MKFISLLNSEAFEKQSIKGFLYSCPPINASTVFFLVFMIPLPKVLIIHISFRMKIFAAQAKYVRGTDASPVLKEVFDLISQEYEACVIYNVKSPEEAVRDAADAVNYL